MYVRDVANCRTLCKISQKTKNKFHFRNNLQEKGTKGYRRKKCCQKRTGNKHVFD